MYSLPNDSHSFIQVAKCLLTVLSSTLHTAASHPVLSTVTMSNMS